jgi:hypothetical protein
VKPYVSQGIVTGFVRDSAGRGVANAVACATAVVIAASGTPVLISSQDSTNAQGAYVAAFNLTFPADTAARLTVAATPPAASGLSATFTSGLSVRVTTRLPPAETTYVNLVAPSGPPHSGVLCVVGS